MIFLIWILIGCDIISPSDELTFKQAVQQVYKVVGEKFFHYWEELEQQPNNYYKGENEAPGACCCYAIEFFYYWNEVFNYDELFGKAYITWYDHRSEKVSHIWDIQYVPQGSNKLEYNTLRNKDGTWLFSNAYRDAVSTRELYKGQPIKHFGEMLDRDNHMWNVIDYNDEWWEVDATDADWRGGGGDPPDKIKL
jgi:hypothetical protein